MKNQFNSVHFSWIILTYVVLQRELCRHVWKNASAAVQYSHLPRCIGCAPISVTYLFSVQCSLVTCLQSIPRVYASFLKIFKYSWITANKNLRAFNADCTVHKRNGNRMCILHKWVTFVLYNRTWPQTSWYMLRHEKYEPNELIFIISCVFVKIFFVFLTGSHYLSFAKFRGTLQWRAT